MSDLRALREEEERGRLERLARDDRPPAPAQGTFAELAHHLGREIDGEVRFDDGSRALYATDGSNYRQAPIGVVIPRSADDVVKTIAACRAFGAPIFSRGCGTSLAGQCCNLAVAIDFSKYLNRVTAIDTEKKLAVVEPGCILDHLRAAATQRGLNFAPDPATHTHCTLGGMLGNDSCGIHSLLAAKHGLGLRISDNTHELEVLTYDGLRMRVGATPPEELQAIIRAGGRRGEIYAGMQRLVERFGERIRRDFPKLPRRVSGYNLDALLPENGFHVAQALGGSESTLVTILEAVLHLVPNPAARSLLVLGYPDIFTAAEDLMPILQLQPTGLEGMDHLLFEWVKAKGDETANLSLLPDGRGFLLVEFGGDSKEDSDGQARHCMALLQKGRRPPTMKLFDDPVQEEMIWKVRESGLSATAWVPGQPDGWPGWEDSAVPPARVGEYLRKLRALFDKYDYHPSLYGHFGQGCIHCRVGFDMYTADGIRAFRGFMDEAADLVVSCGGSLSGEHGDGQARAELLPKMFGPEFMEAFREFKSIWDPAWKMNPGKVLDPYPITSNLRLGTDYNPPQPETHFKFPGDRGSFGRAALRCVGVGECRRTDGGIMCPSFMATREEMHSTRGRAHLLFEMLNGEVLQDGWRSEAVREALDLCLACKGCKSDCPVNVDMATYKAEFLSHHYERRLRPRHAYAMGYIDRVARLASWAPGLANFVSQTPVLRAVAKQLAGIAPERDLPPFAPQSFQAWFARRPTQPAADRPPVLLWPDTFNNYFHPEVAKAAVEVLERVGFEVQVPQEALCCGRAYYDFGMLDVAERKLRRILKVLQPQIADGVPLVGLEPSCLAVFRDELAGLMPEDEHAKRLRSQSFLLSEFLVRHAKDKLPKLARRAILWNHCHHRAVIGAAAEEEVLKALGLEVQTMNADTCCGMAGSFGFEERHYEVSQQIGERHLLPTLRETPAGTLVIADGFSCQTQIAQGRTGREALHLAQVLQMAFHEGPGGPPADVRPELNYPKVRLGAGRNHGLLIAAGALAAGAALWAASRTLRSRTRAK